MEPFSQRKILGETKVHTNDLVDVQAADRLERNTVPRTKARVAVQTAGVGCGESPGNGSRGDVDGWGYRRRGLEGPESRELPPIHDIPGQPGLIVHERRRPDSVYNEPVPHIESGAAFLGTIVARQVRLRT